jgi:hypothetical protein
MTTTTYQPTLTGAVAREHVNDLLREATLSRAAAQLPGAGPRGGSASPPDRATHAPRSPEPPTATEGERSERP